MKYRDKIWLYSQYIENKLTRSEIARLCGVKERTIKKWLERFNIKKFDGVLYKDKDWLYEQYVGQEKTLREIANIIACSLGTLQKWLNYYKIPIRTNNESLKIWYSKGNRPSNWEGGKSFEPYCEKFNFGLKEEVRNENNRVCQMFDCGKSEILNGRRLDVHHIDSDKMQGCNDKKWHLVSLCMKCHGLKNTVEKEFLLVTNSW